MILEDFSKAPLRGIVSVDSYGAKGDGKSDDSQAFLRAMADGPIVYVPEGIYCINIAIRKNVKLVGSGNTRSVLQPHNISRPIITYLSGAADWNYETAIKQLGFSSRGRSGIGLRLGSTPGSSQDTDVDELSGRIIVEGCRFEGLNKGLECASGNIGLIVNHCVFVGNYYGLYAINNRSGLLMHAGCKTIYSGEMHDNIVALYIFDESGFFGQFAVRSTVLQGNSINLYLQAERASYATVLFEDIWNEGSGASHVSISDSMVEIDKWKGPERERIMVPKRAFVFDGSRYQALFLGGNVSDCLVRGEQIQIISRNSRFEGTEGGSPIEVVGRDSSVVLIEPQSEALFGGVITPHVIVKRPHLARYRVNDNATGFLSRAFPVARVTGKVIDDSLFGLKLSMNRATPPSLIAGSARVKVVNDGVAFSSCNDYELTAAKSAVLSDRNLIFHPGWYVLSVAVKNFYGDHKYRVWDGRMALFAQASVPNDRNWHMIAALGYLEEASSLFFEVNSDTGSSSHFRVSALNLLRFDNREDALAFLDRGTFVESSTQ